MAKPGFNGQWVEIFTTGTHTDSEGTSYEIDLSFIEATANHYDPKLHEAPAVIGHPKTDAPAYGWACALRVKDDRLEALFCDNDPAFEALVKEGKFKKRSSAFYLDAATAPGGRAPYLRHVGFLGAQPPAVKGLREIHFAEGEAITFDTTFNEGDGMDDEKVKKTVGEAVADYFKNLFKPKEDEAATFSEAEFNERVNNALATALQPLTAQITQLEEANRKLQGRVDEHSGSATRTEIVAFCERLGSGKFLPAFKRMGVIEFMETLAGMSDKKVSVVTFAEEGDTEVEKTVEITPLTFFQNFLTTLPAFVEFGEQFGAFKVKGDGSDIVDPEANAKMREGMGLKKKEGGDK
ncbi:MAG TPA: hypothetical protein VE732_06650 [Nitrososphaera sp.]|nr:hypothetical protein [Nitrososphaera sp.]